jgi:predicted dehydrogenase
MTEQPPTVLKKPLRIGILGSGWILESHVRGFRAAGDRCQVVAATARRPDAERHVRELLGPQVVCHPDWTDVLRRGDLDAVDILLPHDLHLPATRMAARAGLHVMVEKVMARNLHECDRMIAACRNAGVTLAVTHDRRYHPEWMAIKQIVDSGLLGEITHWQLEHNQDVLAPEGSWIRSRDRLGGGAIMSCLTHQLDGLRWLAGEVRSVACMRKIVPDRMQGETIGTVLMTMRSGALAQCTINWMTRAGGAPDGLWAELIHATGRDGEACFTVERGAFAMLRERPERLQPFAAGGQVSARGFTRLKAGAWEKHERCIVEWLKGLCGEPSELSTTGADSRMTVELAEAAYRSADSGRVVTLPIRPRRWR